MGPKYVIAVQVGFVRRIAFLFCGVLVCAGLLAPQEAAALPIFARQTGQNCLACHAGGQFPELTPYGRMFKMTGYTIGQRTVPLALMVVGGYSKVRNTGKDPTPQDTFAKNGDPVITGGSLFIGGKVTDNIGAFTQITYDNYASQSDNGTWHGHSSADNMDFRYADQFVSGMDRTIYGVSLNNNPSVSDPWNTASAWMQYVPVPSPGSSQFTDANTPYPGNSTDSNVAGLTAYLFWHRMIYGEIGFYRTANQAFSFMSEGIDNGDTTHLRGANNPYVRIAYSHEWGPQNIMVGASGIVAHIFNADSGSDYSDSNAYDRVKTVGIDSQYQYLLDPHTITVQLVYQQQKTDYSPEALANDTSPYYQADGVTPVAAPNPSDTVKIFRAKLSYVYQATYGGALAFFDQTSTTNTLNQTSGYDTNGQITYDDPFATGITSTPTTGNLSGNLGMRGFTLEAFWLPIQYMRVGAQYTAYNKYNGATSNYDGLGRNASDNNTLFLYIWGAY
jgi:hypothetical protein